MLWKVPRLMSRRAVFLATALVLVAKQVLVLAADERERIDAIGF